MFSGENVVGKEDWEEGIMVALEGALAAEWGYVRTAVRVIGTELGDGQARLRLIELYEPWHLARALGPISLRLRPAQSMRDLISPPESRPWNLWVDTWAGEWVFERDDGPEVESGVTPRRAGFITGDGRRHHVWHDGGASWTVKASGESPKLSGGAFYLCGTTGRVYILSADDTWALQGLPAELLEAWKLNSGSMSRG